MASGHPFRSLDTSPYHDRPDVRMTLGLKERQRVTAPKAPAPRPRRSRRLVLALLLVTLAGFLLGLGVPIRP
jgi:hypothetical protein